MLEPLLGRLKRHGRIEDRLAVLLRNDAPSRERAAVTDSIDVVDDGDRGVALAKEIPVKRVSDSAFHRTTRSDQRLSRHEPAEDPRPSIVRAETPEEIDVERLEIEPVEKAAEL